MVYMSAFIILLGYLISCLIFSILDALSSPYFLPFGGPLVNFLLGIRTSFILQRLYMIYKLEDVKANVSFLSIPFYTKFDYYIINGPCNIFIRFVVK